MPVVCFRRKPAVRPVTPWQSLARRLDLPLVTDRDGTLRLMALAGDAWLDPPPAGRYRPLLRTVRRQDPARAGSRLPRGPQTSPALRQIADWLDGRVVPAPLLVFPLHYTLPRPIGGFPVAGQLGGRPALAAWLAAIQAEGYRPVGRLPAMAPSAERCRLIAVA